MEKAKFVARLLAALPLLAIGIQHLLGVAPMKPILEGAGLPLPGITAIVAPIIEVLGGLLLLLGYRARVGALLAIGAMVGAIVAHVRFDWADEPPLALPIVVMVLSGLVLLSGPGAWAMGSKKA